MSNINKNIIRIVIGIKLLVLVGMIISIATISYQQFTFQTSAFPEHKDFLKEKEGVILGIFLLSIPLVLSVIIDFKEQKKNVLNGRWYLLTLLLLLGYILVNQLKGHYSGVVISVGMAVGLVLIIRKQNQLLRG